MAEDGKRRKVDPEEAIDAMARRGRIENAETYKETFSKNNSIDLLTSAGRVKDNYDERINESFRSRKKK